MGATEVEVVQGCEGRRPSALEVATQINRVSGGYGMRLVAVTVPLVIIALYAEEVKGLFWKFWSAFASHTNTKEDDKKKEKQQGSTDSYQVENAGKLWKKGLDKHIQLGNGRFLDALKSKRLNTIKWAGSMQYDP
ncbi:hypothetical protein ETB97_008531 [Aspergillus alliaceus]|uniref:Uncharacterized protein n=1 Tax=Petromyces alliaceus TaxID=209559 RepID=A0A8H6AD68_PETAA|nr:hypothetical protein ETB97_008531 [Aspergillus burnettii]